MSGRFAVFPTTAPGSMFAFDPAIAQTDVQQLAQSIGFIAAQLLRRTVYVLDTVAKTWVGTYSPVGL